MYGDYGYDPALLGRVREDDGDDDASVNSSDGSASYYSSSQARAIEQLSRENAMLRQAAAGQRDGGRVRDRSMPPPSTTSNGAYTGLHRIQGSVPEESPLSMEEFDEGNNSDVYQLPPVRRRFSEQPTSSSSIGLDGQYPGSLSSPLQDATTTSNRKAHWQSSLGFGGIADIPQSRRHSFADVPTHLNHASAVAAAAEPSSLGSNNTHLSDADEGYYDDGVATPSATASQSRIPTLHQSYVMAAPPESYPPPPSQHHQRHHHHHQHPSPQLLYIVTFKCHRADVFYIQEGTGLQVNPGDLVIVEADRGTDLGTVTYANISLQRARELKHQYAEEHYKWLMMFSQQGQAGGGIQAAAAVVPLPGRNSAIGGMGPQGTHGPPQEAGGDIKPKLIKRLAQNHEILMLRDKEGNEAKAKRVCQQKVDEHRLHMEILDAEFQM